MTHLKRWILMALFVMGVCLVSAVSADSDVTVVYAPDLSELAYGERLPDELFVEGEGFISDGNGGLISTTDNEYNAIYFGTALRQFHFHAVMEPQVPNQSIVGGLSFKTFSFDEGKRMDLAITTGTQDKSILIYAFGMLLADNRNENQGGLGGLDHFNTTDPVVIDLYGDRNYYAVFINGELVIETILPLEGTGVFGVRAQNSLVRYSDLSITTLGDTLLDGRDRYYPETFETMNIDAPKTSFHQDEVVNVSVRLEPEGKAYEDVRWYLDDVLIQGANSLTFDQKISSIGSYELKAVVDRQQTKIQITITESLDPIEEPIDDTPLPLWAIISIVSGGVMVLGVGILIFMKYRIKK
ncbi:MAG: hypothetical protein PHW40_05320 [Candidatus Izemoplasmatales bacterium]|nr:hypothetical protein [Candidatus Izemoplasmatales bacterium]